MSDRELLERMALEEVCVCLYYDLADSVYEVSDEALLSIVEHRYKCAICGA